tara:strand:- start:499 stop:756 length:258 start_codon:yes stop_codon:yes gene_type:complete
MIDIDKYEGHTEDIGRWQMMGRSLPHWANKKDEQLVRDAPLLLEEVKRLRDIADTCLHAIKAGGDIRSGTITLIEHNLKLMEMIE